MYRTVKQDKKISKQKIKYQKLKQKMEKITNMKKYA